MRGGALPPALLCVAFGFALAFAPRRWLGPCLALLAATAAAASFLPIEKSWDDIIFLGCWISVIVAAASVHLPAGVGPKWASLLAINSGLWTGAVIAVAGSRLDLAASLPLALICLPGAWIVARGRPIVLKVMASWLIAVSILALSLQMAPTTPGYRPDHMD